MEYNLQSKNKSAYYTLESNTILESIILKLKKETCLLIIFKHT